LWKT
uniref:Tetrapandin-2 n=1 Tax=Pandinus imperator TaxID=55084 RepID=TPAN2_PANIM